MLHTISVKQLREIESARADNNDPKIERKLTILAMRGNGALLKQIAAEVGCTSEYASNIIKIYQTDGLAGVINSYSRKPSSGLSFEEEQSILAPFMEKEERCEPVRTKDIAAALRAAVPNLLSQEQIYAILHRHGWHRGSFRNTPTPLE